MNKLILLFPLILFLKLSNGNGFKKLNDEENKNTTTQCGKFADVEEAISTFSMQNEKNFTSLLISPYHALLGIDSLNDTFDTNKCNTEHDVVTEIVNGSNVHMIIIGSCSNPLHGIALLDVHSKYKQKPQNWFCVNNEILILGTKVNVINDVSVSSGEVVDCDHSKQLKEENIFCLKSEAGSSGFVLDEKNKTIIGFIVNNQNENKIKAFSIHDFSDSICNNVGICHGVVSISTNTETTTQKDETKTTTKESIVSSTTSEPSRVVIPSSTNKNESTVTSSTNETTTTEKTTTEMNSTEISSNSTQAIQSSPLTLSTKKPDDSNDSKPVGISTKSPIKSPNDHKPEANSLTSEQLFEAECENDNICFDEDIFGSSRHFNILFIFSLVFFLIFE